MTTVSPERPPVTGAPGETPRDVQCLYCGRIVSRTDAELADLPYPQVGPCCSDMCSIIRRHNTPEWGGA